MSTIDGNEITKEGKITAGILLVAFTLLPIIFLIAYWPDKLPSRDHEITSYNYKLFHIELQDSLKNVSVKVNLPVRTKPKVDTASKTGAKDSTGKDTAKTPPPSTVNKRELPSGNQPETSAPHECEPTTIGLNAILLILVALAGFLGSMIYIGSSFTDFVGNDKLKSNWLLWYIVKPFTGMGLAIVIYFVFRAGLLNFNDPTNINLYGIVTLAVLAGLFTDDATLKLKEVFEVIFKPKDVRVDKLDDYQIKITGITPEKLVSEQTNNIIISGEGLDKQKLQLKMSDKLITDAVIKSNSISFSYKIPDELKTAREFKLVIMDEKGKELYSKVLGI